MRIVVIGGTGHVGSYLVPQLVAAGHTVINVSRQARSAYFAHPAWADVTQINLDRTSLESDGAFGAAIANLQPDIVIDMICFHPDSAAQLVHALKGHVRQYLQCGSMWVHGYGVELPVHEAQERRPLCDYGKQKLAIEAYLLKAAREEGFPATVLHPGHIVGKGWAPVNPAGNLNLDVFHRLAKGEPITLPDLGLYLLHHVHADDVVQAFQLAIRHPDKAIGEAFQVVSPAALSMRGYAEAVADWFGREAKINFQPATEWLTTLSQQDAAISWDHMTHSIVGSIEKARRLLQYEPQYSSLDAIKESIQYLIPEIFA
jgi:nucleoside-diphosphate-sugar epimerase